MTSLILEFTSRSSFTEKILRKGFPNLRSIDVVYSFDETLGLASTIPPEAVRDSSVTVGGKKEETEQQEGMGKDIGTGRRDVWVNPVLFYCTTGPLIQPHTIGYLHPWARGKVVDLDTGVRQGPGETGELCFKTESMSSGYSDLAGEKKEVLDGWVHTGDFGYYDPSGTFYVTGPLDEVFKYYAEYVRQDSSSQYFKFTY